MGRYRRLGILSGLIVLGLITLIIAAVIYKYYSPSPKGQGDRLPSSSSDKASDAGGEEFSGTGPRYSPWPMYQGSVKREGRSRFNGPDRGVVKWMFPIDGLFEASPVIALDGTIYIGGHNSKLYAITPNGKLLWTFQTRDINRNAAAIGPDGTIYLPSADNSLYALSHKGKVKWVFTSDGRVNSSPAIGVDGVIYFGSHDKNLYALYPNGVLKWKLPIGTISASSPAIAEDGTIYIGSYDGHLYAVHKDGRLKWKFVADSGIRVTPAIGGDGEIYIGSRKGTLYAVSPDGLLKWTYRTDNDIRASAAIGRDGTVYVGSWDNYFYAFSPSGEVRWRYKTNGPVEASAIVDAAGNIYVGSVGDKVYSFNPDGKVRWAITGGMINTAPAIAPDGTLYLGREHNLLSIGEPYPTIVLNPVKGGPEEVSKLKVKMTNSSVKDKTVDIKVFIKAPGGRVISLESGRAVLKGGESVEKVYEFSIKKGEDPQGGYFAAGRLLDAEDGTLLAEDSMVIKLGKIE